VFSVLIAARYRTQLWLGVPCGWSQSDARSTGEQTDAQKYRAGKRAKLGEQKPLHSRMSGRKVFLEHKGLEAREKKV
jgi:hypothetical protein